MIVSVLHPGLALLLGALLLPLARPGLRPVLILGAPALALVLIWLIPEGSPGSLAFMGYELQPLRTDNLGRLFATIFAIMALGGGLFALRTATLPELVAAMFYAASAIGVTLAGDLISLFISWELMLIGSTLVIWSAASGAAHRAGMRYLMVHLLGGMLLLIGIIGHADQTGSLSFAAMHADSWSRWLILSGFLVSAAAPPLSAWLPDAYPEASPGGAVFLSAFTTKAAVYALMRGFPGTELLIYVGLIMIFYGIIYALLENDMRRILAYSIVNQVGFMIVGIGIGTSMAINGAAAHAFAHIIYKSLLFMSAGSVLYMTGRRKCTDLGGLYKSMPLTTLCAIIGAVSISGFPLTSGFISKSLIVEAAANQDLAVIWFLLIAASAGVFLHAGIKFPWFVFFHYDSGLRPPDPPFSMRIAMLLFAALCIGIGVFPATLYMLLPYPVDYIPYTGTHVVQTLQLLLSSGLAFFVMLPVLHRTLTITLDLDWFYRRMGPMLVSRPGDAIRAADARLRSLTGKGLERMRDLLFHQHGPQGILARTWPTGSMVLWVAVLLGAYLLAYLFRF
ncbi:MAG: Na(+)/H(+) antiporter subunit D [Gammaproteobacteria bacterium]